ncbi:MAG: hypothetical protein IJS27_02925 [Ruminococcus sp.]|nr:hypothetical protein [Ruminococcus sp.]MBQ9515089.1 hypothetical protein [Ruminococcus sp.]
MEKKFEQKLKAFLPYIIIIGLVYLLVPALLFVGSDAISYLVLIGVLPLTAGICCAHYAMHKENDFYLCLVAPIFFIPAMFLYPIFRSGALIALIYLVSYLLCGYLGLTIGDILAGSKGRGKKRGKAPEAAEDAPRKPAERRAARRTDDEDEPVRRVRRSSARPERVEVEKDDDLFTEDPYQDDSLNTATTSDDIDAILSEIHRNRDNM